jgi:hypothetical protein
MHNKKVGQKLALFFLGILLLSSCGEVPKRNKSRNSEVVYHLSWVEPNKAVLNFGRALTEDPRVVFIMKCCNTQYDLWAKKMRDGQYQVDTKSLPRGKEWHILIYYKNEKITGNLDSFNS